MKRYIAMFIMSAVITSWISTSFPGNIVYADQEGISENELDGSTDTSEEKEYSDDVSEDMDRNSEKKTEKDVEPTTQDPEVENNNGTLLENEFDGNEEKLFKFGMQDEKQETVPNKKKDLVERLEKIDSKKEAMASLQIPEKLDITIDPFEINGKGQIFSKEYTIKNSGETAGLLRITNFMCIPGENSGVILTNESSGIHDANEKFAYMEILFGNGSRINFPSEDAEYEVYMEPGEELRFFYRGEVNENASQGWREHDLMVGMVYFWNIEKEALENEINFKEEIPAFDWENIEDTIKEDEVRKVWENESLSDISEGKDQGEMKQPESSAFGENDKEGNVNSEKELKFEDRYFQKIQSDLIDRNRK